MNSPSTPLQQETVAPFTHIFLSLDLLENEKMNDDCRSYVAIIRKNMERLRKLIHQRANDN
jgi:hypothetical protein